MNPRRTLTGRRRNVVVAFLLGVFVVAVSLVLHIGGVGVLPPEDLRALARVIVENSYNPRNETLTAYSPNAVSAIIWDYRGIDTILETAVLFAAVAGVALLLGEEPRPRLTEKPAVPVVLGASTAIVLVLTSLVSVSIAVHGHLTPGGGFQAGAIAAAAVALAVAVYPVSYLRAIGLGGEALLKVRTAAFTLILVLTLAPPLVALATGDYAYVLQNQVKEDSRFSAPSHLLGTPLAGTIFFFNLLEAAAVAAALSYIVIAITRVDDG